MSDEQSNWVGDVQVENGNIQFTGPVRVNSGDAGTGFYIVDPTDSSKKVVFDLSAQDPDTTNVFDSGGFPVTLDGAETLTNKTITDLILEGTTTGATLAFESDGDLDFATIDAGSDITFTGTQNIVFASSAAGDFSVTMTDGDISLQTAGTNSAIILGSATDGGNVYINASLRLDRVDLDTGGAMTFKTIAAVTDTTTAVGVSIPVELNVSGFTFIVKDESGGAATHNITITPDSGDIDGGGTKVISTNYGVVRLYCDGTNWFTW